MKRRALRRKKQVYLDYAAATPLDPRVLAAMRPWLTAKFANPSALYAEAVLARAAIESARQKVTEILFTQPDTILFTSGGTESNNLGILGITKKHENTKTRKHIITTAIEHHSVLESIRWLERNGWRVTYLPVDQEGRIDVADFKKALRKETALVSIQYANNEIGTVQPIADIGREILKWRKQSPLLAKEGLGEVKYPLFHIDACQAAAYLDLNVEKLHVDLMSLNGSKIYGPKGIGALYKRRGVEIEPLMYGGGQEFGLRSGTENMPGIIGMAAALELVQKWRNEEMSRRGRDPAAAGKKLRELRDYFWWELQKNIEGIKLNGSQLGMSEVYRLPNNLNITFQNIDAEALILYLDAAGIQCSSQSACSTDTDEVSHVLLACGLSEDEAKSSVRFTLGKETTKKDIDYVLRALPAIVKELRRVREVEMGRN